MAPGWQPASLGRRVRAVEVLPGGPIIAEVWGSCGGQAFVVLLLPRRAFVDSPARQVVDRVESKRITSRAQFRLFQGPPNVGPARGVAKSRCSRRVELPAESDAHTAIGRYGCRL